MKELDVNELINMNYRMATLLGIAWAFINEMTNQPEKCKWFNSAIQAVVYENKPIPDMPK